MNPSEIPRALIEQGFEVSLDATGEPRFRTQVGRGPRILVTSVPKAGTYLVAALLEGLGSVSAGMHVAEWGLTDTRHPAEVVRSDPLSVTATIPVEEVVPLIAPGQFVVGHLPHSERVESAFAGFSIIFLRRDVRDAFVSFMRYMGRNRYGSASEGWGDLPDGRAKMTVFAHRHGAEFFSMAMPMASWCDAETITCVTFEDLVGDNGTETQLTAIANLADVVGPRRTRADELIRQALAADTLTRSSERTHFESCWSDEVDQLFSDLGGYTLNRALGYS